MRILTDAVKAHLETNTNSYPIGDSQAPKDVPMPYAVLYPLDDENRDGDYRNTQRTSWYEYQVTTVAQTRKAAEGLADELRSLMLAADLTPTGFRMYPFEKQVGGTLQRDDEVQPPIFYLIFTVAGFVAPV